MKSSLELKFPKRGNSIYNYIQQCYLPEGNAVDLGGSVGVILLVPGLKSFT